MHIKQSLSLLLIASSIIFAVNCVAGQSARNFKGLDKAPFPGVKKINPKLVKQFMMAGKLILIDISANRPFERNHVCGAINGKKLGNPDRVNLRKIPKNKFIVIC